MHELFSLASERQTQSCVQQLFVPHAAECVHTHRVISCLKAKSYQEKQGVEGQRSSALPIWSEADLNEPSSYKFYRKKKKKKIKWSILVYDSTA